MHESRYSLFFTEMNKFCSILHVRSRTELIPVTNFSVAIFGQKLCRQLSGTWLSLSLNRTLGMSIHSIHAWKENHEMIKCEAARLDLPWNGFWNLSRSSSYIVVLLGWIYLEEHGWMHHEMKLFSSILQTNWWCHPFLFIWVLFCLIRQLQWFFCLFLENYPSLGRQQLLPVITTIYFSY